MAAAKQGQFKDKEKPAEVRSSNIIAAKGELYVFSYFSSCC
jgi:hypothetical protein